MRARRLQLYWIPGVTTVAVAVGWTFLDLPERGALIRDGRYGFQLVRVESTAFLWWSLCLLAAVWVAQALTDRPRRPSPFSHYAFYVGFCVVWTDVLFLAGNHGRTPTEAGISVWPMATVVAAAWLGRFVAARLEDARAAQEGEWDGGPPVRPSLALRRSESALWVGAKRGWGYRPSVYLMPLVVLTMAVGGAQVRGFGADDVLSVGFMVCLCAYAFATMSVEVTVSESTVSVRGGPFRVPLWTIPLDDVAEARVEGVRPRDYGGWGYHAKGGRRCLIVRAGDALVLRRTKAKDVVVTVDAAQEGAALVNALVARSAAVAAPR